MSTVLIIISDNDSRLKKYQANDITIIKINCDTNPDYCQNFIDLAINNPDYFIIFDVGQVVVDSEIIPYTSPTFFAYHNNREKLENNKVAIITEEDIKILFNTYNFKNALPICYYRESEIDDKEERSKKGKFFSTIFDLTFSNTIFTFDLNLKHLLVLLELYQDYYKEFLKHNKEAKKKLSNF